MNAGDLYRLQAHGCRHGASQSAFYAGLFDALAIDADAGGPAAVVLESRLALGPEAALPLRLLGGVHRMVLAGAAPELAARYPSTGGDGDLDAAIPQVLALIASPPPELLAFLDWDPQTNEVGRAAALAVGLAVIAGDTGLPIRLFEIGASGGLNLRLDRFGYEAGGGRWGDAASPVRFGASDYEGVPPFAAGARIAERRGCDLNPIDSTTEAGALTLLSFVWPDQADRLARLRAALDVARGFPVAVDRAPADAWLDLHVGPEHGTTTVLMHSIMWQYLPAASRTAIVEGAEARGAAATLDAPFAWLSFEPSPDWSHPETRVRIWPHHPDSRLVATSSYHGPPVQVL